MELLCGSLIRVVVNLSWIKHTHEAELGQAVLIFMRGPGFEQLPSVRAIILVRLSLEKLLFFIN